jgi:hypothetical protein
MSTSNAEKIKALLGESKQAPTPAPTQQKAPKPESAEKHIDWETEEERLDNNPAFENAASKKCYPNMEDMIANFIK